MLCMPAVCPAIGGKSKVSFPTLLLHPPTLSFRQILNITTLLGQGFWGAAMLCQSSARCRAGTSDV